MLCPSCQAREHERHPYRAAFASEAFRELNVLLCERCGSLLPPHDETDALLAKLAQLSRFGLAAGVNLTLTQRSGRG